MSKFSNILCVIDPTTEEQPGLARAAWLAKKSGAAIEMLVCYYNEYLSGDRLFDSPSLEKARSEVIGEYEKKLEKLAEPLRAEGITVTSHATWDHPLYEGIVRRAVISHTDLVVKDTHHHSAVERVLFTNTDWNLIRSTRRRDSDAVEGRGRGDRGRGTRLPRVRPANRGCDRDGQCLHPGVTAVR